MNGGCYLGLGGRQGTRDDREREPTSSLNVRSNFWRHLPEALGALYGRKVSPVSAGTTNRGESLLVGSF